MQKKCPVCSEPLGTSPTGAFCSPRCRSIDLGKWLTGDYVISRPLQPEDADEDLVPLERDGEHS